MLLYDVFGVFTIFICFLLIFNFIKNYISKKTIILEHKWIMICGFFYIFFRIVILILFNQTNLEVTNPLISYLNSFSSNWSDALFNFYTEFVKRLSFNLISSDLRSYFAVIIGLLLILPYVINYKRKNNSLNNLETDWVFNLSPLIFVCFFILIITCGRVVIRGHFGVWYIVFLQFSALCIWVSIFILGKLIRNYYPFL